MESNSTPNMVEYGWNMTVTLHVNHIKVESNKYGFTYDWAYEKDQFVDYGDY